MISLYILIYASYFLPTLKTLLCVVGIPAAIFPLLEKNPTEKIIRVGQLGLILLLIAFFIPNKETLWLLSTAKVADIVISYGINQSDIDQIKEIINTREQQ